LFRSCGDSNGKLHILAALLDILLFPLTCDC